MSKIIIDPRDVAVLSAEEEADVEKEVERLREKLKTGLGRYSGGTNLRSEKAGKVLASRLRAAGWQAQATGMTISITHPDLLDAEPRR